jgi:integrase
MIPGERHRDRVISREEEVRYLFAAPPLLKDVATILLDCGLRPEECFRLQTENVRDGAIHINWGKTKAARRRIPLTPRVKVILDARIKTATSEWVFPAPTRSGHMEGSSVKKQQARVFRVTRIKPFELYCLRHTCLTRWAPQMDAFTLAYLAGHTDITVTKRYVHPEDETVKAAMERAVSQLVSPPSSPTTALTTESAASSQLAAVN